MIDSSLWGRVLRAPQETGHQMSQSMMCSFAVKERPVTFVQEVEEDFAISVQEKQDEDEIKKIAEIIISKLDIQISKFTSSPSKSAPAWHSPPKSSSFSVARPAFYCAPKRSQCSDLDGGGIASSAASPTSAQLASPSSTSAVITDDLSSPFVGPTSDLLLPPTSPESGDHSPLATLTGPSQSLAIAPASLHSVQSMLTTSVMTEPLDELTGTNHSKKVGSEAALQHREAAALCTADQARTVRLADWQSHRTGINANHEAAPRRAKLRHHDSQPAAKTDANRATKHVLRLNAQQSLSWVDQPIAPQTTEEYAPFNCNPFDSGPPPAGVVALLLLHCWSYVVLGRHASHFNKDGRLS